jgi:PAS domain S-box-containing protein
MAMVEQTIEMVALDASMDAVIVVDDDARILRWNVAAAIMFGRSADDAVGRDLAETIVPSQLRAAHRAGFDQSGASFPLTPAGGRTETLAQRADGTVFPIEITIVRLENGPDSVFVGFLRDITDRRRLADELRDSRARLLSVTDDARRRVERDLHDGAQQQLVALAISLATAREQLTSDPVSAGRTLGHSMEILDEAIDELRELARGVHSKILTERGLGAALTQLARRSPIEVLVKAESIGRLPSVIETSLYYSITEAVTNATRYGASRVWIEVHRGPYDESRGDLPLVVTVSDDGPGGADPARGSGLTGMAERADALGGTMQIDSLPGQGTTLRFDIPTLAAAPTRAAG